MDAGARSAWHSNRGLDENLGVDTSRPPAPRPRTATELKAIVEADRAGRAFLVYRDGADRQRIVALDETGGSIALGRGGGVQIRLDWDGQVSAVHAELRPIAGEWTLVDDGLSVNGTWLNNRRLAGRHRLRHGDEIRLGGTSIRFRDPTGTAPPTTIAGGAVVDVALTEAQRRVLVALCRPLRDQDGYAVPASNRQVADELVLSVEAVKTHLRTLFARFDVGALPQNEKRLRLAERALESGAISWRDL